MSDTEKITAPLGNAVAAFCQRIVGLEASAAALQAAEVAVRGLLASVPDALVIRAVACLRSTYQNLSPLLHHQGGSQWPRAAYCVRDCRQARRMYDDRLDHEGWNNRVDVSAGIPTPPWSGADGSEASQPTRSKILVLDADAETRHLVGKMLASLNYEVTHTRNGAEAVAAYYSAQVADQPFTAVMLECPISVEMGGREILAQLRAIDPQVKALLSRRDPEAQMIDDCRQYGFCGVLTKPYTVAELYEVLQRVLHG